MSNTSGSEGELLVVKNFIDGDFVDECGAYLDSVDPSTGRTWAKIPDSSERDVELAVESAAKAFVSWSKKSAQQRSELMFRIAEILESRLDEFAELESRDQGKPVALAKKMDIPRAVYNIRFFASYILHDLNRSRVVNGLVQYSVKEPVGVAGLISPWNLPLYLLTFKLAPAIAAGNTVVAKPSELTSVTAYKLCEVFKKAGLPPGVINMVFGRGAGAGSSLVTNPRVPLISFTGGTVTAEKIRRAAAGTCKKFSLELGGKNAAVIFDDADMDKCVRGCIRSSFENQGEICLCTSRIFVQRKIYPEFLERFISEARKWTVGDPRGTKAVDMGPLISRDHMTKVTKAIQAARDCGGTIHTQDGDVFQRLPEHCQGGYYVPPTVITDVSDSSDAMQEEIFGPVTCVVPFDTEEEVTSRANNVKYGLCGSLWTRDASRAHRMSHNLQVGTVWVNCWLMRDLNMPFGGVKESGVGREGGMDSMEFYTQEKNIAMMI